jgi:hypothetical protein
MSRKQFGGWGWELSDREFGQALALLGAVAGLQTRGPHGQHRVLPLTKSRARSLIDRAVSEAHPALSWDLAPAGGIASLRAQLREQPALDLVYAWNKSQAGYRPLEIRPAPGIDNRWLVEILEGAVRGGPPHFRLPEPAGQLRWSWPLRVGFAVGDEWLRDRIYAGSVPLSQSVAALTEPEVGPDRCDLLVMEKHPGRRYRDIAAMALPEATLVVIFEHPMRPEDPIRARAIAARANAWGVVVVEVAAEHETEWLRTFLRELSHLASVPEAARRAGNIGGLLAATRLLYASPLREAAASLQATLSQTAAMSAAEPMLLDAMPRSTMEALDLVPDRPVSMPILQREFNRVALQYRSERGGASHVAAVARAAAPALDELERGQAEDRFIRTSVEVPRFDGWARLRRGFQAGRRHRIGVSIGPPDRELIVGSNPVPRDALDAAVGHRLTVVLSDPILLRKPLLGTVALPPFGPTETINFELPVGRSASDVHARITILHRGRILQTAILRGPVYAQDELDRREALEQDNNRPRIELRPEANLRPGLAGLDDRTRYHSAIVLNHDRDGRAGGTAIGPGKAVQFNLDFVTAAVAELGQTLERAERDKAFDRKLDSAESLAYLRLLAFEGRNLHTRIGKRIEQTFPGRLERLQVLSANPNTMLPVELIYDLPPPVPKPKLCPNAAEALRTGRCDPKQFHILDEEGFLNVVCPSGFWGISKIIEREATDPERLEYGFIVRSTPTREKRTLGPMTPVLFAASDHVNDVDPKELNRVSKALETLTNKKATRVERWSDWAGEVKKNEPPLLLLLSHTELNVPEGPSLEIARAGGPELRAVAAITDKYVNQNPGRPGPVVMLLGCTTAVPLETFQSFTVQFADMGASLVIGTIAPVLGRHAGRTAEALIEALNGIRAAAGGRAGVPVGEALRDVRRQMLAKGILMSMSLAAYGDADWRLPVEA